MAIFHLNHKAIGRTTHAAGTAGAHVDYIVRSSACDLVIGEHMLIPTVGSRDGEARRWLNEQEQADRKNARVIDKVTVALPHELTDEQQVELVRGFAASVTGGQAPYLAAFHRSGKDTENKHCHLVLRDRHIETGKRVWGRSGKGLTEELREKWEAAANAALAKAEADARIDRRNLWEQGIKREPQRHEGPAPRQIQKREGMSEKIERIKKGTARRKEVMEAARAAREAAERPTQIEDVRLDMLGAFEAVIAPARSDRPAKENRNASLAVMLHHDYINFEWHLNRHLSNPTPAPKWQDPRTALRLLNENDKAAKDYDAFLLEDDDRQEQYTTMNAAMKDLSTDEYWHGQTWRQLRRTIPHAFGWEIGKAIMQAVTALAELIRGEKFAELSKPVRPNQTSDTGASLPESPSEPEQQSKPTPYSGYSM